MLHWLQNIHPSILKLLLPVPLFLIGFAVSGEFLTNQLLSRSYNTLNKLQADNQTVKTQFAASALVTAVELEKDQDGTIVQLKTEKSVLKQITFSVPAKELNAVKIIIAAEMGQTEPANILQTGRIMPIRSTFKILGILAEIDKKRGVTIVKINTANSVLKNLEFEFPVTNLRAIKTTLIQQLGLSNEDVSRFVSYRIIN
jgi:CxxC motif-containing protein